MSFALNAFLSLLIGLPALTGLVRFKLTDSRFHPFLFVLLAGFASEIAGTALALSGRSSVASYNIYSLAESLLLLWQMARWEAFRSRAVCAILQAGLAVLWCWESFYNRFGTFNSYHLIAYSVITIILSIPVINRVIYQDPTPLLKNSCFLICGALVIFCTYSILVEIFWLYGLGSHQQFRIQILSLLPYINLFCNLVFTLAVLWAPMSYRSIMRY